MTGGNKIAKKKLRLSKDEAAELLKSLGKESRILAVENSVGNQCLKDIITKKVLAEILDLKIGTLRSYRKNGLPYIKVGIKTYYSQKSVYIWLLKREKGG